MSKEPGEAEDRVAFLLKKYASEGEVNPEKALEDAVNLKLHQGQSREQAIDELYQEHLANRDAAPAATVKTPQSTISQAEARIIALGDRVELVALQVHRARRTAKIMFGVALTLILVIGALSTYFFLQPGLSGAATTRTWQEVANFADYDDTTTSVFPVQGEHWRITWYVGTSAPEYAGFGFYVYPEGGPEHYVGRMVTDFSFGPDTLDSQAGVEYFVGSGRYYLRVLTANVDAWIIHVESYEAG